MTGGCHVDDASDDSDTLTRLGFLHPVLQMRESPTLLCVLFCFSIPCVCDYVFVHVSCENYHLRMRTCHEWHAYIYVA